MHLSNYYGLWVHFPSSALPFPGQLHVFLLFPRLPCKSHMYMLVASTNELPKHRFP